MGPSPANVAVIGDEMNRLCCMESRIRPLNKAPLLGVAMTVRTRPGDNLLLHRALDMAAPGDIIVVDGQGELSNAIAGENMMMWAHKRRLGGVIVDGAMRDIEAIAKMSMPVFASMWASNFAFVRSKLMSAFSRRGSRKSPRNFLSRQMRVAPSESDQRRTVSRCLLRPVVSVSRPSDPVIRC